MDCLPLWIDSDQHIRICLEDELFDPLHLFLRVPATFSTRLG